MRRLSKVFLGLAAAAILSGPAKAGSHDSPADKTEPRSSNPDRASQHVPGRSPLTTAILEASEKKRLEEVKQQQALKDQETYFRVWFEKYADVEKRLKNFSASYLKLRDAKKSSSDIKVTRALTKENLSFQDEKGIFKLRLSDLKTLQKVAKEGKLAILSDIDKKTMAEEIGRMEKVGMMADYGARMLRLSEKLRNKAGDADFEEEAALANQSAAKGTIVSYRGDPQYLWARVVDSRPIIQSSSHGQDIGRDYDTYFRNRPPEDADDFGTQADSFVNVMGVYAESFTRPRPSR